MSQETHYICDACGKRAVKHNKGDRNTDDDTAEWFYISISVSLLGSISSEKKTYECGQVCSVGCMEIYVESMRQLAITNATGKKV